MNHRINTTSFIIICFLFIAHTMASSIIAGAIDEGEQKNKTSERIYRIDNGESKTITRKQVDVLASPQHTVIDLLGLPPENPSVVSKQMLDIYDSRGNKAVIAPQTKVIENPKLAISKSQIVAYQIDLTLDSKAQLEQAKLCGILNPKIGHQQVEVEVLELKKLREQDIPFKIVGGMSEFLVRRRDKDDSFMESGPRIDNGESVYSETNIMEENLTIKPAETLDTGYRHLIWDPDPDYFLEDGYGVWVTWPEGSAPSGAVVTSVEYRLWVGEEDSGQTDFWCNDYIISFSSEQHGQDYTVCKVWDRDGGHTDNGEDDDSADDYDIYLNWRSTSYFNGEDANQKWYAFVGDFASGDDGNVNYIQIQVYWETQAQNDFIAVDCYGADASDIWTPVSAFDAGGNIEICFKWSLTGPNVAATTAIRLDDGSIHTSSQEYEAGTWCSHWTWENATEGWHRIRGWCDYEDDVVETDENNNQRDEEQCFKVEGSYPDIRIEPTTLNFDYREEASKSTYTNLPMANSDQVHTPGQAYLSDEDKTLNYLDEIKTEFEGEDGKAKIIVTLEQPLKILSSMDWDNRTVLNDFQQVVQSIEDGVLSQLSHNEFIPRHQFENFAGFSGEVTPEGLEKLLKSPIVQSIRPVRILKAHLNQGIPLINGLTYRSTYNGQGLAIAICDTGIDYNHPKLGNGNFPNDKIIGGYDFGDNDSDPIPNGQAHGTCCAGIAAGDPGSSGDYIGGVAYSSKLYALKISYGSSGSANEDDMIAAWDWCVTHKNDNSSYPIMVISTSFGGSRYFSSCDTESPAMTQAADNAVAAGITVLASSGNDGWCESMGWPACISSVISIGAIYDDDFGVYNPCVNADCCHPDKTETTGCSTGWYVPDTTMSDKVTAYSNSATFLDFFGPSNRCYTCDIAGSSGYSTGDYYSSFGGTSAACPYVAGAVASLQSAAKAITGSFLSPSDVKTKLWESGDNITDSKVDITKPRVNLGAAISSLVGSGNAFTIYNDGTADLEVIDITKRDGDDWLESWNPDAPFSVAPGDFQVVTVTVNPNLADPGLNQERLEVYSDDPPNPYPGAVFVNLTNPIPPPSVTPTPSVRPTASPSATSTPVSPTPSPTMKPPATPTPRCTVTPIPGATVNPPATPTPRYTVTPIPTATVNSPATTSPTPEPTQSPPSITPTPRYTVTPTPYFPVTPLPTPHSPFPNPDFNGDGTSDIAVFRETSGLWAVRGLTRVYFGGPGDVPVADDYDGDRTSDIGIYRSRSGLWAIRKVTRAYFGGSEDQPVPGDYRGEGTCSLGIYRAGCGLWAIRGVTRAYFGGYGDEAVPGYYDDDEVLDIGIFRPASGLWALRGISRIYFGSETDWTVPGDYNGDGIWEAGIFRSSSGLWALRGVTRIYFGGSTDQPVPADYDGDATDNVGIFRKSSGLWAIRGSTRVYFGGSGDTPVTR